MFHITHTLTVPAYLLRPSALIDATALVMALRRSVTICTPSPGDAYPNDIEPVMFSRRMSICRHKIFDPTGSST